MRLIPGTRSLAAAGASSPFCRRRTPGASAYLWAGPPLILLFLSSPPEAVAQLPGASAAVLATGHAHTALARGALAGGVNPAGLGMPGNPRWSLIIPGVRLQTGLEPVTLGELSDFQGETVPRDVKLAWLDRIVDEGGQRGTGGGDLTVAAVSRGRWALQVSGLAGAMADLSPDGAELLLFGNSGRTGEPRELALEGSRVDFFAVSSLGVSAGFPLSHGERGTWAVGGTLSLTLGHMLVVGQDGGSLVKNDPVELELEFPVVHPDFDEAGISGSGLGVDLAAAWERGSWSAGAVVENLVHTFEWDTDDFVFRPGQALFDVQDFEADFQERPFSSAPFLLRKRVRDMTFKPRIQLGVAFRAAEGLAVAGEFQRRLGSEGLPMGPRTRMSVGAEYEVRRLILRGGLSKVTDGRILSGGVGVRLGPVEVAGAGALQRGSVGDATSWMLSLSFSPR